jgi:hypothetical protein
MVQKILICQPFYCHICIIHFTQSMKQAWVYIKFVVLLSIWILFISSAILHPDRALLILKLWGFGMLIIGFVYGRVWLLVKMFKPSELQPDNEE